MFRICQTLILLHFLTVNSLSPLIKHERPEFCKTYTKYFDGTKFIQVFKIHTNAANSDGVFIEFYSDRFVRCLSRSFASFLQSVVHIRPKSEILPTKVEDFAMKANEQPESHTAAHILQVRITSSRQTYGAVLVSNNLSQLLAYFSERPITCYRCLYLLVFTSKEFYEYEIFYVLKTIWEEFNILNVIVHGPISENSNFIYMYNPFYLRSNGKRGIMKKCSLEDAQKDILLLLNSLHDLKGYTLNISIFKRQLTAVPREDGYPGFYGVDGLVMETFVKGMNITPHYLPPTDGSKFGKMENGKITGSLGEIVRKTSHIAGNSRFLTDFNTKDLEVTKTLYSERLCVVIPKSPKIPSGLMILRVFTPSTWFIILIVIISCMVILHFKDMSKTHGFVPLDVLYTFGLFIGIAVRFRPSRKQYVFLCFCLLFSVVIIGAIQGVLIRSFTTITYYNNIDTLEELAESDLKITTTLNVFDKDESELGRKLYNKKITYKNRGLTSSLEYVCYFKNVSAVGRESEITYAKYNMYLAPDGTRCLHSVTQSLLTFFVVYIVPAHSPFLYKFDSIIENLLERGFIHYWVKEAYKKHGDTKDEQSFFAAITLEDMIVPFSVLFFGYILALIVFVCEMNWKRINCRGNVCDKLKRSKAIMPNRKMLTIQFLQQKI